MAMAIEPNQPKDPNEGNQSQWVIAAATALAGIATSIYNNKQQEKQQNKLNKDQVKYQKELGRFNQELAMETWEKTNYTAQREQMEKAGLNVGLMYGGQGHGGTTSGGQAAGGVTGGQANPNSLGMGLEAGLSAIRAKAEIENIKANTEKQKAETAKTAGVDTASTEASINAIKQSTQNAEMQAKILEYEQQLKSIEANKANLTQAEIVQQTQIATQKLADEARSAKVKGAIDEATAENLIRQAELINTETATKIASGKAGIEQTKAATEQTKAGTEQTKQTTTNLKQDEIQKTLENALRKNGIQPSDNALFRKVLETLNEMGAQPAEIGKKAKIIMLWLKGQAGEQTTAHLKELLKDN